MSGTQKPQDSTRGDRHPGTTQTVKSPARRHHGFTGLSGAGKSTLAQAAEEKPHQMGCRTSVLDGDNVRHGLCGDLAFSGKDREENIHRMGVAKLFIEAGRVEHGNSMEIFCDNPIGVCESRDVKDLYKKARAGLITDFTGISSPYEAPVNPELTVNTSEKNREECTQLILDEMVFRGFIKGISI